MSTVHADAQKPERAVIFVKGAPDVLLARCCAERIGEDARLLTDDRRREIQACIDQLAGEALRTLGVAFRACPRDQVGDSAISEALERDFVFLGLIGIDGSAAAGSEGSRRPRAPRGVHLAAADDGAVGRFEHEVRLAAARRPALEPLLQRRIDAH